MPTGCGLHEAQILDRSGAVVAHADVLTEVEWTRVLDEVSTARIVVTPGGDCCEKLKNVRSWRHKLAIWRDGEPVWEGPILRPEWSTGQVEIRAMDVLAWLDRRVPHQSVRFSRRDLTEIAEWLIADGFEPDDPGHQVRIVAPAGVSGRRSYVRDVGQTGDHLRDLADTGLDYTAVGSVILLLPEDHAASVGSLTDVDLPEGLTVTEDGAALVTRWVVHGGEDDVKGTAGGSSRYYGLLERSVEETSIEDAADAEAAARSRLRGSRPVPVWISSDRVTLSPDAPVDVPRLVPGWCVDVATTATCRTISQRLKITGVRVAETRDGESVQVQLAPTGTGVDN
jgi:hypothetical protein